MQGILFCIIIIYRLLQHYMEYPEARLRQATVFPEHDKAFPEKNVSRKVIYNCDMQHMKYYSSEKTFIIHINCKKYITACTHHWWHIILCTYLNASTVKLLFDLLNHKCNIYSSGVQPEHTTHHTFPCTYLLQVQ